MAKRKKSTRKAREPFKVYLVRHGEARGEPREGELGSPLTKMGEKQAERVAKRLGSMRFDHIYSSDMSRAYHTAQAIIKFHKKTPYTVSPDIREISGHHIIRGRTPRQKAIQERMRGTEISVARFIRKLFREHQDGQILLVIHCNLILYLVALLAQIHPKRSLPLRVNNTSVSIINLMDGGLVDVELTNCVDHLLPTQVT